MFQEQRLATGAQHAAHFRQDLPLIIDRTEGESDKHCIETGIGKGDRLTHTAPNIGDHALGLRRFAAAVEQGSRWIDPCKACDFRGIVKGHVDPAATA